jgi:hypothetical protein|tara:strand:+ start:7137 stop:7289 length:153 start_codon:yes stop_codon:yes gene_type:complete
METAKNIEKYKNTFTEKEKKAYEIAQNHLKSSFNFEKSVGYISYKQASNK